MGLKSEKSNGASSLWFGAADGIACSMLAVSAMSARVCMVVAQCTVVCCPWNTALPLVGKIGLKWRIIHIPLLFSYLILWESWWTPHNPYCSPGMVDAIIFPRTTLAHWLAVWKQMFFELCCFELREQLLHRHIYRIGCVDCPFYYVINGIMHVVVRDTLLHDSMNALQACNVRSGG